MAKKINFCEVCGGTGRLPQYAKINKDVCYKCGGWPDPTIQEIEDINKGLKSVDEVLMNYITTQIEWINSQNKGFRGAGRDDFELAFIENYGNSSPYTVAMINIRTKMKKLNHPKLNDRYKVNSLVSDLNNKLISESEFQKRIYKLYLEGSELKDFFLNDYTDVVKKEQKRRRTEMEESEFHRKETLRKTKEKEQANAKGCLIVLIVLILFIIASIINRMQ